MNRHCNPPTQMLCFSLEALPFSLLQHSKVKLKKPTFKPLGPYEAPKAGMLLAIDTEFVAHSPPDKVFKG